jgi:hypothetical protein
MRLCMVRLRLFGSTLAGTGAKGDVALALGQTGPYWMVTHAHAALSVRMLGAALKTIAFDVNSPTWRSRRRCLLVYSRNFASC